MMVIALFRQKEITEGITLCETFLVARGLCSGLKLSCSSTLAILGTSQSFYWNAIANTFVAALMIIKFSVWALINMTFLL